MAHEDMPVVADDAHLKASITTGVINAVINGGIQLWLLNDKSSVAVTVDSISNTEQTVLGEAVILATSLAMILTTIGYFQLKGAKRPFWPSGLWLVVKHGLFAFGAVVTGAILWQRLVGSVEVSVPVAATILALIAGLVAATIHWMTIAAASLPDVPGAGQ